MFEDETLNLKRLAAPNRILVATDLSDIDTLIPHAVAQAKSSGALVTLLHVIVPAETFPPDAFGANYVNPDRIKAEVQEMLAGFARIVEDQGVSCDWMCEHGMAVDVIEDAIERTKATRLIIATHGRGKLGQFLLGSVARQLLAKVQVPVFAVGPHCGPACEHVTPKRILHPFSMNGAGCGNAGLAIALARLYHAELILLHIPDREVEESISTGCTLTWAESLTRDLLPGGSIEGVPQVEIRIAFGDRVREIREEAERMQAGWIVMGVEDENSLWPLTESVAYRVLAAVNCPILSIRGQAMITENAQLKDLVALA
jgi:nucleotide-binding universal stress UspA family protein